MKLILLGAPGAGKGSQGEIIAKRLNVPIISTGNIIREAIRNETEVGKRAKAIVEAGKLLDDDTVVAIVEERLKKDDCKNGFIFDGFPRTIPQAEALDKMGVNIDKVVNIEVTDEEIMERLTNRRVCPKCGTPFHLINRKPKTEGICDNCGAELIHRADDTEETVKDRLSAYHTQTEPLIDYYKAQGKLLCTDGSGSDIPSVTQRTLDALGI
ncbi:MAG: adenylate kinase [Acutalibacteraceae bacterium]